MVGMQDKVGLDREPDRAGCRGVRDVALNGREPINRRLELGPFKPCGQLVLCDPFPKQPQDRGVICAFGYARRSCGAPAIVVGRHRDRATPRLPLALYGFVDSDFVDPAGRIGERNGLIKGVPLLRHYLIPQHFARIRGSRGTRRKT